MDVAKFSQWWAQVSEVEMAWVIFGFAAQSMFFMRFVLQWIASERVKRSIVPETFWYFSFAGGLMLFVYAVHRADPVIMLGQLAGLFIYARNIYLIWAHKRSERVAASAPDGLRAAE
ncbi:lipid-A-disaccharide synthase N-terminal domain-containing protein [Rhodomicrobium lacus]|jgi:lipid-A-disaccharide synthase-like uncharacterized protein|uniref:lipid-A-disaccharide synthase N-terminal domain-containing protein n=1 Tax=Rhodomicrobium TaxID=1068 RepID=UPI0026E4331E|nr:lipid-A-disaccharide synthase N-terminal domain-containing protein [Rhodomicrobium lacus]WKW50203.1 lipid-A-disaccharide synthase N-terminal domain-containing protein [Rhodomicrobium lacus]